MKNIKQGLILDGLRRVNESFRTDDLTHEKFLVFRMGNSSTLVNKNAGDIEGIIGYLWAYEDFGVGDNIMAFEVTNLAGKGVFGGYKKLRGESGGNHEPMGLPESLIGREQKRYSGLEGTWYSFPKDGAWSAKFIKSFTHDEVRAESDKVLGRRWRDEDENVLVVKSLFKDLL